MRGVSYLLGLTCVLSFNLNAQVNTINNYNSNEFICYCSTIGSTPKTVISLDNNWELLLLLREPMLIKQLDSLNVSYTLSQIQLLETWKLLRRNKDKTYETTIFIMDKKKSGDFRKYSNQLSNELVRIIKPDILQIIVLLKESNREANIYSILFSYILDGAVWDILEEKALISERELSIESPLWAGYFWSLFPKREFTCGTNSISDQGYSIKVNWAENAIPKMIPFVTRFDLQVQILKNLIDNEKVVDEESIDVFGPYNFFDRSGNFTVPVIVENDSNQLYIFSKNISKSVVRFLMEKVDFSKIKKEFGISDNPQAIVFLYHEMLWDILRNLEIEYIIEKPIPFRDPANTKPEDISSLSVIVKK